MQKLQLYIDSTPLDDNPTYLRVDLFKDESVSITQSIKNVKDISKVYTEFTQTFTIPASQTNNKLFKHYYNFDIGTNAMPGFDARKKLRSEIQLNDIPFKDGYVRLEGVELKKNKAYAYKITFFGNTVNLKDILGENQLGSLTSLNSENLDYDYSTVASRFYNGDPASDTILAPLVTHTRQLYYNTSALSVGAGNLYKPSSGYSTSANGVYWSDLKYAHRLYEIILAIESTYDINFSTDFFNTSNQDFYGLYMWLHRKKGAVEPATEIDIQYQQVSGFSAYSTPSPETTMVTGALIIPSSLVSTPNYLNSNDLSLYTSSTDPYNVRIYRNGSLFYQAGGLVGNQVLGSSQFGLLSAGNYTVSVAAETVITFAVGDIRWQISGQKGEEVSSWSDEWRSDYSTSTSSTFEFVITEQIPKMKIIDFLSGLFKLFNLTAYVDITGTIVVRTLDSYYADEKAVTWTLDNYIDIKKSSINVALPFKQVDFKYKGLGTYLAQQYNQLQDSGWGSLNYSLDEAIYDAPEKIYKLEVPFEHLQYERLFSGSTATTIQYGWCVDDNKDSYIGQAIIFYAIRVTGGDAVLFKASESSNTALSNYVIPSNSQSLTASTDSQNINFMNEKNEYRAQESTANDFTDTLFEKYYSTYIVNIFNNKRRLTKITAYLPLKMIYNLELNDKISLNNKTYQINSVKTNLITGKSNFELLNVV